MFRIGKNDAAVADRDMYGIQLSHIFEIPRISKKKHSILIENLGFRPKYSVF